MLNSHDFGFTITVPRSPRPVNRRASKQRNKLQISATIFSDNLAKNAHKNHDKRLICWGTRVSLTCYCLILFLYWIAFMAQFSDFQIVFDLMIQKDARI